jgi:hypothetical protein
MQNGLNNCYIIAAMSAVAHYNMDILKQCFMGEEEYVAGKKLTAETQLWLRAVTLTGRSTALSFSTFLL